MTDTTDPGRTRLRPFDLDELSGEGRALAQDIMKGRGRMPTPYRIWLSSPGLAAALHELGMFWEDGATLTKQEREIVILITAQHHGFDYVSAVHRREAVDAGLDGAVVDALRRGEPAVLADARQRAVAALMTALQDPGPDEPSDDTFAEAIRAVGDAGVAEAIALSGYFTAIGKAMKAYRVPVPGAS